jgi:hypothetical protein
MVQITADDIWGQPCLAYHVQPDLSDETRAALSALQQPIAERCPVPLHLAPSGALHVTLYALVLVKAEFDKEAYWSSIEAPSRALLERLCTGRGAITLHFSQLRVMDTAVIAVAQETSGLIEAIRDGIADIIPPPPGHKPLRYDLIHTTLARYQASGMLPQESVEAIESLPVSVEARVGRIKIVRETVFPCQEMREVASFPLE